MTELISSPFPSLFIRGLGLRLFATCALLSPVHALANNPEVNVSAAIEQVYGPAHQQFSERSAALLASVNSLCEAVNETTGASNSDTNSDTSANNKPPLSALNNAQTEFAQTVDAFSRIELLRVGPLLDDNRLNRLFYWPDSRRVTERQLRQLLASKSTESSLVKPQDISGKSVAVQGLPALERLLFSTILTDLSTSLEGCLLARDIASNVQRLSSALLEAWVAETGISAALLSPSAEAALFRSQREVTRSLLTQISAGLELIASRKVHPMTEEGARLRNAPFGRSVLTLNNLRGNLDSIQALLKASEIDQQSDVQSQLDFEFRIADGHLDALSALDSLSDDADFVTPEAAKLFTALQSVVSSIAFTTDDRISLALGMSAGFNSSDGD